MIRVSFAVAFLLGANACSGSEHNGVVGTVDLGDNFVAPDLALDEDFFYCRIEPEVIQKFGCATGNAGERGQCHDSRSALQLIDTSEKATCSNGRLTGAVPDAFAANYEAARFFVQTDPLTSPLYLRPTNQASHPRRIFATNDPAARLITEWITAGAQ
ncbi:MAG TPA: hypothetical protein VFG30_24390 [Polyangiales bacterium]|jgi:hypothetical protein|nr:hypothetical protein [Polyangiales bacterium]